MSFVSVFTLQSNNLLLSHRQSRPIRELRPWRRRRLKTNRRCAFRDPFAPFVSSSFENRFHDLVSQLPVVNPLDLIAPALGFASGAALYLSRSQFVKNSEVPDIGEWILFTSPTPLNRFVFLRCPPISFESNKLLEDVNGKLMKEDRHFGRLSCGKIQDVSEDESELEYQRVCVGTDDGGVISLDWPATLDLREEHGLDTTVLLVPGTAEGSMDRSVQSFVVECLKRGCFPVVMNPRGCAGSPLTTARLFTAADSDDVCTAIQFINKARPWTTLMGVGWGYGANMLTKYLAEVGEKTPLTAATCIDNPFDLEEAARSSPYHIAINQKLTGGLIDILRSNKELFHGRNKGFDVEKALQAKSFCDFEKAISMVSYGFDAIEDFYSESSTRGVVGNVKIPLLFIQNDDGTVPMFSIPRSLIAENSYTSLLLCSPSPSRVISGGRSIISWCQHCTIEWLMAVELGLLKGRHPLLLDVDITINPSKGLARLEGRPTDEVGRANKRLDHTQANVLNGHPVDPINKMPEEGDNAVSIQMSRQDSRRNLELEEEGLQQGDNGALQQSNSIDAKLLKDDEASVVDNERGQGLQTAQVVINMLDVTMPDTLAEEQKKKVLTAVEQGETIMKALQDAVPEDVRGKLTTAVSGILHSQGTNLNFDGLKHIDQVLNVSSGLKSNIHEKAGDLSSEESFHKDPSDHNERADNLGDGSDNNHPEVNQPSEGLESELLTSEKSQKSTTLGQAQSTSSDGYSQSPDPNENGPVTNSKEDQEDGMDGLDMKEEKNIQNIEERTSDSTDQKKMSSSTKTDDSLSHQGSSSEPQLQGNDNQKREDENSQLVLNQNESVPSESNPPTDSVPQALDALTGVDDSTQVAVNNVFGVIEETITHLEGGTDNQNKLEDRNEVQEKKTDSVSEAHHKKNDHKLDMIGNNANELSLQPDILHDSPAYDIPDNQMESHMEARNGVVEEKPTQSSNLHGQVCETEVNHMASEKADQNSCLDISTDREKAVSKNVKNDTVMVGTVTAALEASALMVHQQDPCKGNESDETSSKPVKSTVNHHKDPENLEETGSEKYQSNIVTSLSEKAMSVAGPVVPTKEGGEVDQERLLAMLANLGQKGGMLRLFSKLALLWGGLRGAMSLTDKLILFLRIAERPLFLRILGFISMVLVLWSPVVVPLLPTLVQGWATHNSSRFAELVCIAGLYTAVMILVMLWGKRIRGYDNPLEQYGLDFAPSSKIQNFAKAFIGGATLVLLIQSVNSLLGCVSLSWPSSLPYSSLVSVAWLKAYGKMLLLVGQGVLTATAIALVEELLFRSWLPAEIATDLGYHRGIILSGFAFSLLQRSPQAIPGLWLLSLGLAGARQRSQGSLSIPIGLRAGIMTASFILQTGGFLTYHTNLPFWVTETHPFQPFSGIVGLAFSLILAVVFYPRQPLP